MKRIFLWTSCLLIGLLIGRVYWDNVSDNGSVSGVEDRGNQLSIVTLIVDYQEKQDRFKVAHTGAFKTALDLLRGYTIQKDVELQIEDTSYGPFVKSIGGKEGNNQYFWSFLINGELSMVGAGEYELLPYDEIEFSWTKLK